MYLAAEDGEQLGEGEGGLGGGSEGGVVSLAVVVSGNVQAVLHSLPAQRAQHNLAVWGRQQLLHLQADCIAPVGQ